MIDWAKKRRYEGYAAGFEEECKRRVMSLEVW